jgi:hypothetical protein
MFFDPAMGSSCDISIIAFCRACGNVAQWEAESKSAALAFGGLNPDTAAVSLNYRAANVQAKTGAAGGRFHFIDPVKLGK